MWCPVCVTSTLRRCLAKMDGEEREKKSAIPAGHSLGWKCAVERLGVEERNFFSCPLIYEAARAELAEESSAQCLEKESCC